MYVYTSLVFIAVSYFQVILFILPYKVASGAGHSNKRLFCRISPHSFTKYFKHEEDCFFRFPSEKWVERRGASVLFLFFNLLQGVWTSDKTLFRVFDIASQTIDNSCRNSKQTFTKFYVN